MAIAWLSNSASVWDTGLAGPTGVWFLAGGFAGGDAVAFAGLPAGAGAAPFPFATDETAGGAAGTVFPAEVLRDFFDMSLVLVGPSWRPQGFDPRTRNSVPRVVHQSKSPAQGPGMDKSVKGG
jgi:hypothetical protein